MYLAVSHSNVNRRFTLRVEHINARLKIQQLLKRWKKKKKKSTKREKKPSTTHFDNSKLGAIDRPVKSGTTVAASSIDINARPVVT
jgi:hypothetical protein